MRIFFAGTPDIAVPSLKLLAGKHDIAGVLTNPDRPGRRGRSLVPPPVKTAAEELGLPVFQPRRLDAECIARVKALAPRLLVVVAYGRIFRPDFLSIFPEGGINLHPSLLPRHRGCSPIQAAILAGDGETGITIQRLAEEMDSGDILAIRKIPLDGTETGGSLSAKAGILGAELLDEVLQGLEAGRVDGSPQGSSGITFCHRINKEDGRIDWSEPAVLIERKVRAFNPAPGAWTTWKGKRLVIHKAAVRDVLSVPGPECGCGQVTGVDKALGFLVQTGSGTLAVGELQLQAKRLMDWRSFLNGNGDFPGSVLGGSL